MNKSQLPTILNNIPDIPLEFCNTVHNVGMLLLVDDIHDLGHFVYYNRNTHYYRGKKAPDHPSPLHHWQLGIIMLMIAKIAGLMTMARESLQLLVDDDDSEDENEIIGYDDYVKEFDQSNNKLTSRIKIPKLSIRL